MNILEAMDAMSKGKIVLYKHQKHRMKITSWVEQKGKNDNPEWNVYYYSDFDSKWVKNNNFSLEEILSDEWQIFEKE